MGVDLLVTERDQRQHRFVRLLLLWRRGMRLPFAVAPLFERWLDEHFPERKAKVLSRIRAIRGGDRLSDPRWGTRIKGEGIFAEQIATLFQMSCRKVGIGPRPELSTQHFRSPREQLTLF